MSESVGVRWVLVDGYSVLHAWTRFVEKKNQPKTLARRREELIGLLAQYADQTGRQVTVVFDGYAAKYKPLETEAVPGVEVLFSDSGQTADDLIERVVALAAQPAVMLVVTSDNAERRTVESLGAHSQSAEVFEEELANAVRELGQAVRQHGRRRTWGGLRDKFER